MEAKTKIVEYTSNAGNGCAGLCLMLNNFQCIANVGIIYLMVFDLHNDVFKCLFQNRMIEKIFKLVNVF